MDVYEKNILSFKDQLSFEGVKSGNLRNLKPKNFDSVVMVGMGGSGAIGEILKNTASEINLGVPVFTVKNYALPGNLTRHPLFIFVSFSGNTQETLSAMKTAIDAFGHESVAVVSGGGKIMSEAIKKNLAFATFSRGTLTPRQSSGIMYYGVISILKTVFPVKTPKSKIETISRIRDEGERIAKQIDGNVIVYSLDRISHLSLIWKNNFNETAKNAAFVNAYPEINHNEIEGFNGISGKWTVVFLDDFKKFEKRKNFLLRELKKNKIKTLEIAITGKGVFEKTWNGIILSHFTSLFLARRRGIDPAKVDIIERLKKI